MIHNNITQLIGNTPMVLINKINNTQAVIAAKLEFFNPSNSIKDRAAFYMINEALKNNLINENSLIIEPTSGNTGIAIAMCAAVLNLKTIIVMPENMSEERKKIIKAYGAKLVLTPENLGMKGAVDEANKIAAQNPNSFIPAQFSNNNNTLAHIETTAVEIFEQTQGKVDFVVCGIGTGGTAVGIAKGLKKLLPNVKIIGVEPQESPLISQGIANKHKIQGIGANFIPDIFDKKLIDEIITIKSEQAISCAKKLALKEGILCGISSGANVQAALNLAGRSENKGKLIVTIVCDFGERYLSTELFDD